MSRARTVLVLHSRAVATAAGAEREEPLIVGVQVKGRDVTADQLRTLEGKRDALDQRSRRVLQVLDDRAERSGRMSPLTYNLTIGHQHRFVWYRVAKVATRSTMEYFAREGVALGIEHKSAIRYPTELFADYFRFAFVRHPLDRFLSCWRNKIVDLNHFHLRPQRLEAMRESPEAFARWVLETQDLSDLDSTDRHLVRQTRLIDLSQVGFLGHLERFDDDFAHVCEAIGLPVRTPEVTNRSSDTGRNREPSAELVALVREAYALDFQVFGY